MVAEDLLEKNQIGRQLTDRIPEIMQHESPPQERKAFMYVQCQYL
jgi:hypothetical protein